MRLSESKRTDARPEEKTSKQYVPLHHVKVTLLQQHLRNCWNEEGGKPTPTILVHWLDPLARPTGSTHCQTTAKPLDFNRPLRKKKSERHHHHLHHHHHQHAIIHRTNRARQFGGRTIGQRKRNLHSCKICISTNLVVTLFSTTRLPKLVHFSTLPCIPSTH